MQHFMRPTLLAFCALTITGLAPLHLNAQDRQDEHRDEQREQRPEEHRDEHQPPARDEHRVEDRNEQRGDPDRYRHDHPNASARCHDGFFTTTRDRGRACRQHGGIDVWLVL